MRNFNKEQSSPLDYVDIKVDDESHISIKKKEVCLEKCENKPCTYYCPTRVFSWQGKQNEIRVDYQRCIECLACPYGCPYENIAWEYPHGGYGVIYQRS
ncbi:ferredoxin family protein [Fuchsiella alkaliacetigena]|uniref:ferredoxin family protein n=1 Tax=Fuchsiella alkaliacetigena TaxID=957042 RepID=UPI00200B24EA|nr:4Fe-4S dicluster domain-containing protein [Fuchsiella alkaliacetigena]MCK8823866.1 4Fe-4S dicluster domain-containing protein [Fuchsiella alkaliacetigena]